MSAYTAALVAAYGLVFASLGVGVALDLLLHRGR